MIPVAFDEENTVLEPPEHIECDVMSGFVGPFKGETAVVTCWKMEEEDVELFAKTHRIWMVSIGGQYPVILTAIKPFEQTKGD